MNGEHLPTEPKANVRVIFALTMVHFIGDFYASFINPLLPVFVEKFSISMVRVGLISGLSQILAFIVQPTVGYIADSYNTRFFSLGGPFLAMVSIPMVGMATGYWMLLIIIGIGSIGISMFHPTTAGMISTHAGRHLSFSMGVFILGGTLSFGIGPVFIAYYVMHLGLEKTPYTMLIGLMFMIYLFRSVPHPEREGLAKFGFLGSIKEAMGAVWKIMLLIWIVLVLRTFVSHSFLTFIPVLMAQEGYTLVSIGAIISIFIVAGAISGLISGMLADRMGFKPIFYLSFFLSTPSYLLFLSLHGNWVYLGSFLSGFIAMATMPLGVTMAQELMPKGRSMASSIMMGLSFGTGGLLIPLAGRFADAFGIRQMLLGLSIIPLLIIGLVRFFPQMERKL